MTYDLGIDLGTTYTASAVYRDGRVEIVPLGDRAAAVPSVVFVRDGEEPLIGEAANRRSTTDPSRVAREFKRRIGDTTPIILGTSPYSPETLMAALLRWVIAAVTRLEGEQPGHITICHPANWGPYKREVLTNAVRMAELDRVDFISEPEAAATFYASTERLEQGGVIAVYDLGGGTFDATVLAKTESGFKILGQPEGIEHLGGIDFDRAVFAHVNRALGDLIEELDPADQAAVAGVVRLRQECSEAKEALSTDTDVSIPVLLPTVQTEVRLSRGEFEDMIRPAIAQTVDALQRALRTAGIKAQDVTKVLLVGGSSRIPLVGEMVSAELGRPVAVDAHPKHAIAIGAALAAARPGVGAVAVAEAAIATPPPEATAGLVELDIETDAPAPERSPVGAAAPAVAAPTASAVDAPPVRAPAATPAPAPVAQSAPAAVAPGAVGEPAPTSAGGGDEKVSASEITAPIRPEPPPTGRSGKPGGRKALVALVAALVVIGGAVGALFVTGVIGGKSHKPAGATGGSKGGSAAALPAKLFKVEGTSTAATDVSDKLPSDGSGLAAGMGGVWAIDKKGLFNVDPNTGTVQNVSLPNPPTAVADNFQLGLWVGTSSGTQGVLYHLDATSHQVLVSAQLPNVPSALWVEPPVVWVLSGDSGNLFEVDATTGKILASVFVGNGASDIAVAGSAIWVANPTTRTVSPVSLTTATLGAPIQLPGADSVAPGGGAIWVVDKTGGRVFPVDLKTGGVQGAISVGKDPFRIRIGEGVLWVANATSVSRIDFSTRTATNIPVGGRVAAIAPTHLTGPVDKPLWVLDQSTTSGGGK